MKDQLKQYVKQELLDADQQVEIHDDDNLLMDEIVDSMGMIRLVAFIEDQWAIQVPPEDVTIENFMSISTINHYLERRLK